jgi:hypothetical protein
MANIKITDLPELTTTPNDANLLEIVDKASETPTSKKITWANIKAAVLTAIEKVNGAVGFTLSGGTTSKTLTVEDTSLVNQDLTTDASPTFANITDSGLTASQTIFSDAGKKLITKSAADTMIALVGTLTANYKCFVNAAGNGTEWAAGFSIVSFSHDMSTASGDKAITGAGFKPKAAILIAGIDASVAAFNIGMCVDTTEHSVQFVNTTMPVWHITGSYILYLHHDNSNYTAATVASMDADGMTLTMTKAGSPTATIQGAILFLR